MARIVVAMSGGVDSSVAAALLRAQGHDVVGLFMRHGQTEPQTACASGTAEASSLLPIISQRPTRKQGCCSVSDSLDARRVADRLDVPFYALDFTEDFDQIIDYFVSEYVAGHTPNPCVMCNNWLKFGKLLDYADSIGAEFVATGHYAQIVDGAQGPELWCGRDRAKDQSYVLFGIGRHDLARVQFPVGSFTKGEIRDRARELGLRVADKQDSQEICFVPNGDYATLVRNRNSEDRSGQIVTTEGQVVGTHQGYEQFTIGQRKGLGVALGEPRYVVRIETDTRRVVIGTHDELAREQLTGRDVNWLCDPPTAPFECSVKIRYNSPAVGARVTPLGAGRIEVRLHEARHGIAAGQAVVCYAGDRVLGGGWIE
jgi:tRNA-specific 2-thiouridylase